MEARYAWRKRPWLDACQMDPESFAPVMPRRHTCMQPFGRICQGPAAAQQAQPSVWGLRSNVERQNIAAIADRLGHSRLPLHSCIGWDAWAAAPWREEVRSHVQTPLGHSDGVLGCDPSGFPTSGRESVGVARHGWGRLGKGDTATEPSPWAMSPATGAPWSTPGCRGPKQGPRRRRAWPKRACPKRPGPSARVPSGPWRGWSKTVLRCRLDGWRGTTRGDDRLGCVVAGRVWVSRPWWPCLRTPRGVLGRSSARRRAPGGAVPSAPGNTSRPGARRWRRPPGTEARCARAGKGRWGWKPCRAGWSREPIGVNRALRRHWLSAATVTATRRRWCRGMMPCPPRPPRRHGGMCPGGQSGTAHRSMSPAEPECSGFGHDERRHGTGWQQHQTLSLLATGFLVRATERGKQMDSASTLPAAAPGPGPDLVRGVAVRDALAEAAGVSAALATP